jgi:hypothetical protein
MLEKVMRKRTDRPVDKPGAQRDRNKRRPVVHRERLNAGLSGLELLFMGTINGLKLPNLIVTLYAVQAIKTLHFVNPSSEFSKG